MNCKGKNIIVTGGATGYGYGTAKKLTEAGANVTITGRRLEVLQTAAKELNVKYVQADITKGEDWDRVFDSVDNKLDVLINNAGAGVKIAPLAEQSDEEIIDSININMLGALLGCRRVSPIMQEQKSGLIINVSSICSHYAWPGFAPYTAAKAGLDMFSRALYTELRPHNVRVTVVTPSWGSTQFRDAVHLPPREQEMAKKVMSPEQMGDLMTFLCGFHEHLEFPEIQVQPLIQEIVPF